MEAKDESDTKDEDEKQTKEDPDSDADSDKGESKEDADIRDIRYNLEILFLKVESVFLVGPSTRFCLFIFPQPKARASKRRMSSMFFGGSKLVESTFVDCYILLLSALFTGLGWTLV